jgi:hypothetical protein
MSDPKCASILLSDTEPIDRVSVIKLLEALHDHVRNLLTSDCND